MAQERTRSPLDSARLWVLLILAPVAALSLFKAVTIGMGDVDDLQWHEGRMFLQGINPYAAFLESIGPYDPSLGDGTGADLWHTEDPSPPVQLPSVMLMFAPFAWTDFSTATVALLAINLVSTLVILWLGWRLFLEGRVSGTDYAVLVLLLLASNPWRVTVAAGQHGLIAIAFFLIAFYFFERRALKVATIFAALSMFKYSLVLPFFALFLYRLRDAVAVIAGVAVIHIALTLWVGVMVSASPVALVQQSLRVATSTQTVQGAFDFFVFFHRVAPDWSSVVPAVFSAIVVAAVTIVARKPLGLRGLGILAIVSIIIVYHRVYDAFVLLFLCFHLSAMLSGGIAPRHFGSARIRDLVELGGGVLVVCQVFFGERILFELVEQGILTSGEKKGINAGVAMAIYGYLVLLLLRHWMGPHGPEQQARAARAETNQT